MIVIFDTRFLAGGSNGISRDAKAFHEFLRLQNVQLVYLTFKGSHTEFFRGKNIVSLQSYRAEIFKRIFFNRKINLRHIEADYIFLSQPSPLIFLLNKNTRLIFRIHDFFPKSNPNWFTLKNRLLFELALRNISNNAFLLSNSNYTKHQVSRYLPDYKGEIFVVPCDVPGFSDTSPCDSCNFCRYGVDIKKFILSVGTVEPRKNYLALLKQWQSKESDHDFRLVIVGSKGWKSKKTESLLNNLSAQSSITYLGRVCDWALRTLYESADAFLSVSLDEGFDIPAHEASHHGLPLILSDIPVHNEHFSSLPGVRWVRRTDLADLDFQHLQQMPPYSSTHRDSSFLEAMREVFHEIDK